MTGARTVWFSFHLGCHRPAVSLSIKCFSSDSDKCPDVGIGPLLQFPHPLKAGQVLLSLLFFPLVPSSYWVLPGLYIHFLWSGTPVHSQLVFCMHFCVWRCIPDVSVERDVLHAHLLICHLALRDYLSVCCDQFFCGAYMSECHHGSGSWYGVPYSVLARYKQWFSCHKGLLSLIHPSGGRLINEKFELGQPQRIRFIIFKFLPTGTGWGFERKEGRGRRSHILREHCECLNK